MPNSKSQSTPSYPSQSQPSSQITYLHTKHPLYHHKHLRESTIESYLKDFSKLELRITEEQGKVKSYVLSDEELAKYRSQNQSNDKKQNLELNLEI